MIKLSDYSTLPPIDLEKGNAKKLTNKYAEEIGELHTKMAADGKHSLLIVLQGMDSSGKDGAVRDVFKDCLPTVMRAHSFKKPTDEEFAHDFLWRCHKLAPRKGRTQIFIRSHYEDVLIQRVHNWIDEDRVAMRMEAINAWEKLLKADNNTTILKFYLHLSYEQQEIELQQRIDEKDKHYKHNDGDWEERKHWDKYIECYEDVINKCSDTPWHIIPVDKRWYRSFKIAEIVKETMESWNLDYPPLVTNE